MTVAFGAACLTSEKAVSRAGPSVEARVAVVLTRVAVQSDRVHCWMRLANPMSFPPIVIVTRFVDPFRAGSWLAIRSEVFAPEQATKLNDAIECFWVNRYG